MYSVRKAPLYIERLPLGLKGESFQGDAYFTAPNPPFGSVFTYFLKDELKSRRQQRLDAEAKLRKDAENEPPPYPTPEQLRAEERELDPMVFAIVSDEEGNVVRRVSGSVKQ